MIELLVKAVLAYLLGSIVGSLLIARLTGSVDIRTLGSRSAGATNALRTLGKGVALTVLVIDIAKGWIATRFVAPAVLPGIVAPPEWHAWAGCVCGIAVILGHVYPLWHGFRGGKGVATLIGAVLGIHTWLLVPMILTWLVAVILFGYVGFASMLASIALGVAIAIGSYEPRVPLMTFGVAAPLLVIFTHRANIARMRAGTESRAQRLWLLGRLRSQT